MSFAEDIASTKREMAELKSLIDARVRSAEAAFEKLHLDIANEAASYLTTREAPRPFKLLSGLTINGWLLSEMGLYLSTDQGLYTPDRYLRGRARADRPFAVSLDHREVALRSGVTPFAVLTAPGEIQIFPERIHVQASTSWGPEWQPTGTVRLDWFEGLQFIEITGDPVRFLAPLDKGVELRDALIRAIALQY